MGQKKLKSEAKGIINQIKREIGTVLRAKGYIFLIE